jgi:pimeloyl-ACP methyl ester carboxylesterase
MRPIAVGVIPALLGLGACASPDGGPGAPPADHLWTPGTAPTLLAGSGAIQIGVMLDRTAVVSYAIFNHIQSSIDPVEIRDEAAGVGNGGTLRAGAFTVSGSNVGDTARVELDGFPANTNLFIYLVADPAAADPAPSDLDRVVPLSITTAVRQPGTSYGSAAISATVGYYTYLPDDHYLHPDERFPLLVFLHGSGEKGNGTTELGRVLVHGPPKLVGQGIDFPFIDISPQLPVSQGGWPVSLVDEIIARAKADTRVDTTRIYLTGLSLGGFGTWSYALSRPDVVAAVVPIAGAGSTAQACAMKDVPVWAFHGDADGTVDVSGSVNMVAAINGCSPGPRVIPRLTIYPGVGHDSWTRTYDGSAGHDIYTWLLGYHR